jgi:aldehyde:ferredoxin oxidoreductase
MRVFNAREGFGREDDTLPPKMFQPLEGGPSDGVHLTEEELEAAKNLYYQMAGWDVASGHPTRQRLDELDLFWLASV